MQQNPIFSSHITCAGVTPESVTLWISIYTHHGKEQYNTRELWWCRWLCTRCVCHPSHAPCEYPCDPASCRHTHTKPTRHSQLGSCWSCSLFSLAGLFFVVLSSQLCWYLCIPRRSLCQHRRVVFPHLQNTLVQTPCDSKRTALTQSSVPDSLCCWDNGISKIWGSGREFASLLNIMAGAGFGIVSSETHFKAELCFYLDGFVCLQTQCLYHQGRSSANKCFSVV